MLLSRNKTLGTATVTFDPATETRQKADVIGRNAFHVPAKFTGQTQTQTSKIIQRNPLRFKTTTLVVRHFTVPDWS